METIFIQIASYKDPELIETIRDCLHKSSFSERLRFGICWQKTEDETVSPYSEDGRFRIHAVDWRESRGVGWARNICNGLYESEDFTLQIDSHHRFEDGWDVQLIEQWRQCLHPKAVLSGYPPEFKYLDDGTIHFARLAPRTMIVKEFFAGSIPIFKSGVIPDANKILSPHKGCFISAGFLFTIGSVCEEVPYCKEVYFSGEEILHSLRLYTYGYRVFHPHKWVIWHLYKRLTSEKHWSNFTADDELKAKYKEIRDVSMDVVKQTLHGSNKYPGLLGTTNTLEDFENYCGIKFKSRVLHPRQLAGYEPPFEQTSGWEDSVSPLKEWCFNFTICTEDVPECDDYDFWYFALHDSNCVELHRDDIRNSGGMVMKESVKIYTTKVLLREKPEKYIIWPHSASKGWIKRLVYDIPESGVTLTTASSPELSTAETCTSKVMVEKESPIFKIYQIELTNHCNMKCSYCPHPNTRRVKGYMSAEVLGRCIDMARANRQDKLVLHHFGEPLLHIELHERLAQVAKSGLTIQFSSNAKSLEKCLPILFEIKTQIFITLSVHQWVDMRPAVYQKALEYWQERTRNTNITIMKAFNAADNAYRFHKWDRGQESEWNFQELCFFLNKNWGVILWDGTVVSCCVDCEGESAFGNIMDDKIADASTVAWRACPSCDLWGHLHNK